MKYIVEVNAKYLVSIEAESLCDAEHKLLDYNGIWGAMAYDRPMMKTDTFAGAVQGCEMVSMTELATMVNDLMDQKALAVQAELARQDAEQKVQALMEALEEARGALLTAEHAANDSRYHYDKAAEKLGKQRN
jgi:hypothetical protein